MQIHQHALLTGTARMHGRDILNGPVPLCSTNTGVHVANVLQDCNNAFGLKAPRESPTFTGAESGDYKRMVGLGRVPNASHAIKPIPTATQRAFDVRAPKDNPTSVCGVSAIFKSMAGYGKINNNAAATNPIVTETQTALYLKATQ